MKFHNKLPKILFFVICGFFLTLPGKSSAQTLTDPMSLTTTPATEVNDKSSSLLLTTGISNLSATTGANNETASGLDISLRYQFALDEKWAVAGEGSQGLNVNGFGTLYTALSAMALYSVGGDIRNIARVTKLGSQSVSVSRDYIQPGWILSGGIKQYFFNGTNNVFPMIGPSLGAYYQFSSAKLNSTQAGVVYDMGTNGDRSLTSIKIFVGLIGFR